MRNTCMRESAWGIIPMRELTVSMPWIPLNFPVPLSTGPKPPNLNPGCPGSEGNFRSKDTPETTPAVIVPTVCPF